MANKLTGSHRQPCVNKLLPSSSHLVVQRLHVESRIKGPSDVEDVSSAKQKKLQDHVFYLLCYLCYGVPVRRRVLKPSSGRGVKTANLTPPTPKYLSYRALNSFGHWNSGYDYENSGWLSNRYSLFIRLGGTGGRTTKFSGADNRYRFYRSGPQTLCKFKYSSPHRYAALTIDTTKNRCNSLHRPSCLSYLCCDLSFNSPVQQ